VTYIVQGGKKKTETAQQKGHDRQKERKDGTGPTLPGEAKSRPNSRATYNGRTKEKKKIRVFSAGHWTLFSPQREKRRLGPKKRRKMVQRKKRKNG